MISEIQKEQANVDTQIERLNLGEKRPARKLEDKIKADRIMNIILNRDFMTTANFLRAIAHNLKF